MLAALSQLPALILLSISPSLSAFFFFFSNVFYSSRALASLQISRPDPDPTQTRAASDPTTYPCLRAFRRTITDDPRPSPLLYDAFSRTKQLNIHTKYIQHKYNIIQIMTPNRRVVVSASTNTSAQRRVVATMGASGGSQSSGSSLNDRCVSFTFVFFFFFSFYFYICASKFPCLLHSKSNSDLLLSPSRFAIVEQARKQQGSVILTPQTRATGSGPIFTRVIEDPRAGSAGLLHRVHNGGVHPPRGPAAGIPRGGGLAFRGFAPRGGFARGMVNFRGNSRGAGFGGVRGGRGGFLPRGRGLMRGGRGGFRGRPLNKDDLDKELDSYMMKDPKTATAKLDDELDEYMEEVNES